MTLNKLKLETMGLIGREEEQELLERLLNSKTRDLVWFRLRQ